MDEFVKITIRKELYQSLIKNGIIDLMNHTLEDVIIPDFDYSTNETWIKAKSEARKTYKALKEIEFKIRNYET